jgi:DNA-binding beta-propeller fold protein YncE
MKKCRRAKTLLSILLLSTFFILTGCGDNKDTTTTANIAPIINAPGKHNFGVVAFANGGIGIIDGKTKSVVGPLLVSELGTKGGGRFDVAITPDGNTTLVSNFGDSKVFFIDTSDPTKPGVLGSLDIEFFAEDIDITPDGRYALVTDGGFRSLIAVVDIQKRTLVETFGETDEERTLNVSDTRGLSGTRFISEKPEPSPSHYHNAVAVAKDGKTVLTADYYNGKVHAFTLSATGHLCYVCSTDVSNGGKLLPVNLAISPDGMTVIVASVVTSTYINKESKINGDIPPDPADMAFPVLTIWAPGQVVLSGMVKPTTINMLKSSISQLLVPNIDLIAAQSIAFSKDGSRAYLNCVQPMPYTPPPPNGDYSSDEPENPKNVIVELMVVAPGQAISTGKFMEVDFIGSSQLFGVDTLAMDNVTGYLWVSNMTLSQARNHLQVLDVNNGILVKTITFAPLLIGETTKGELPTPTEEPTLPTGLRFWNP